MRKFLVTAACLAALAACGQTTATTTVEAPTTEVAATTAPMTAADATAQDTCGAAAFQALVGTTASAIDLTTLPAGARVITPDMMVTQDFRAERLNIIVGTDGKVGSLACY